MVGDLVDHHVPDQALQFFRVSPAFPLDGLLIEGDEDLRGGRGRALIGQRDPVVKSQSAGGILPAAAGLDAKHHVVEPLPEPFRQAVDGLGNQPTEADQGGGLPSRGGGF